MMIAVDFDGTIVESVWPDIGEFLEGAVEGLFELKRRGHQVVLYTCREDVPGSRAYLSEALAKLASVSFFPDYVNETPTEVFGHIVPRKPLCDVFIDDRSLLGFPGWKEALEVLSEIEARPQYPIIRSGART